MAKAKLVTRSATTSTVTDDNLNKASALTHAEMDSNLINLRDSSFGIADDTSTVLQVTHDKTITVEGGTNITTALSGDTLTITGPDTSTFITATSTDTLQNKTIDTANNTITITESDISDLGSYITASSTDTLTNKSGNISQWTNDSGYKTSVSESDVTQHQSALAVTESQITDLQNYITDANITIVGDDSTGTSFSAKDNDNIKITGTQNTAVAVSGDTITVTGPDLSSYATQSYVDTQISNTVDSAPETLNTLNELAAALGDDANFATTTSTALGNRLRVDTAAQGLTTTQKTNAKTNLGLATVASTGAYSDLTGTPTIPTNNNQLTNGAGYLTSVAFADVTSKPTTIAGYGITDAFDGAYSSLSGTPTIPSALTDLSITDGSNGQVLTTDGAGNFSFTSVSGGAAATGLTFVGDDSSGTLIADGETVKIAGGTGITTAMSGDTLTITSSGSASTGDFSFIGNEMSTTSSNADMELGTSGTGAIVLKANGGSTSNISFTGASRYQNANMLYQEDLDHTAGSRRLYGNSSVLRLKLDGTATSSGDARFVGHSSVVDADLNGTDSTNTGGTRGPVPLIAGNDVTNSSATTANLGSMATYSGYNYLYDYSGTAGDINVTNANGLRTSMFEVDGITATATNAYGFYAGSPTEYGGGGNGTVTNSYGFYYSHNPGPLTFTNDPYAFYTDDDSIRNRPGALEKFNEYSYNATHSSGSTYTIDWANGNLQTVTLTSNITGFTMTNFPTSTKQSVGVTLYLVQDGTGSRAMTFSAASGETFKFSNGTSTSSVSSANDIQVCYIFSRYDGSSNTFYWTIGPAFS